MNLTPEALLTVEEVAEYLRTTPNTVYRWCRSGKLPARRIAKEWRISIAELDQALTGHRAAASRPLSRTLANGLRDRDHVAVITGSGDGVYEVESAFFQLALSKQGKLFKGCWWQHPDDVRQRLTREGLPVDDLESAGRLIIVDLTAAFRRAGIDGVVASWMAVAAEAARPGGGRLWGSGAPRQDSCGGDGAILLALEDALHRAMTRHPVVAICPYYFAAGELCAEALLGLAQHHAAMLLHSPERSLLLRRN